MTNSFESIRVCDFKYLNMETLQMIETFLLHAMLKLDKAEEAHLQALQDMALEHA